MTDTVQNCESTYLTVMCEMIDAEVAIFVEIILSDLTINFKAEEKGDIKKE